MDVLHDVCLRNYTTVRIGGRAENLYVPENMDDLVGLLRQIDDDGFYVISGGSNILMNDKKVYKHVIAMAKADRLVNRLGEGRYYVGASVRLQDLINLVNADGFGGIEYLYTVPALVGGAVAMNAGRGKDYGLSISDYIEDVHVYDRGTIRVYPKQQCKFTYRNSVFKNSNMVVIGATFRFDRMDPEESSGLKRDRVELARKNSDATGFSFGSLFSQSDGRIMYLLRLLHPGYKGGVSFSRRSANWMINYGQGTYSQAVALISLAMRLHKLVGQKAKLEVVVWD